MKTEPSKAVHNLLSGIPQGVASQLQTPEGVAALLATCEAEFETVSHGPRRSVLRRRVDALKRMATYLLHGEKAKAVQSTIANDLSTARSEVKSRHRELLQLQDGEAATVSASNATGEKIAELQTVVDAQEMEKNIAVSDARKVFDEAMQGDDDAAQRLAAENLSAAESALHLQKQSSPDVLRLQGFSARQSTETRTANELAERGAAARESYRHAVLREKLILMDLASNQMLIAYADVMSALADCNKRPFLHGFDSVTIWASSERRMLSLANNPKDAPVTLSSGMLGSIGLSISCPDLSCFAETSASS